MHQASTRPTCATLLLQGLLWVPDPHVWATCGGAMASPSFRAEHKGSTVSCELLALGQTAISLFRSPVSKAVGRSRVQCFALLKWNC